VPPTFTWEKGKYDRFRVMVSWDPSFPKGERITSGKRMIRRQTWTPTQSQWQKACSEAGGGMLYARVYGVDTHADGGRQSKTFSNMVHMDTSVN